MSNVYVVPMLTTAISADCGTCI